MNDYAHINTRTITMTPREWRAYTILCAVIAFAAGVVLFGLVVALVILPTRDAEAAQRIESAYARGAMVKIAASKARCQQWQLRAKEAVCE